MHEGALLSGNMNPKIDPHYIGSVGLISGGKYMETLPPEGIPAYSWKLIDNVVVAEI